MPALKRLGPPALVIALAIAVGVSTGKLFTDSDTIHYLHLAAGQPAAQPFAARQLAPVLVRALTHLGLTLHQGFWLLGVASLTFFVASVTFLLQQTPGASASQTPPWLLWSVLGLYFWSLQFAGMVLPDLFYAALLSGFLLLVRSGRLGWASGMLLPLMVARESTILVLLCWLYVAWRTLTWSKRLLSIAAAATGATIVHFLAAGSRGNREGLSPVLYLLGKMPWNFAKNFLGLEPWANLNRTCEVPVWHHAVHLGPLSDIGYCTLQPEYPERLLAYALATFGLLPLLLWWVRKASRQGLLVRFSLVYGITAFLTAPLLGYSVQRLYGYGWPAFLVGLPLLAGAGGFRSLRWLAGFLTLHLVASWLEWRLDKTSLLVAELLVWSLGFWVLHGGWAQGESGTQSTQRLRGER